MPDASGWFPMDSDEIRRWAEAHLASLPRNLEGVAQYRQGELPLPADAQPSVQS